MGPLRLTHPLLVASAVIEWTRSGPPPTPLRPIKVGRTPEYIAITPDGTPPDAIKV